MSQPSFDPIDLAVFQSAMHSIAEEMGAALRRTALSPNIKERRDYSCAVFDAHHRVIAMGDHMPVHLGSMPLSVEAAVTALTLGPGDIALLNDPYLGGTHLPDLTTVMPVFRPGDPAPSFYVAARAHHSDIGGTYPGSMGPARNIFQEGLRIPPVRLVRAGVLDPDLLALILRNVRTPAERHGDLAAQLGACRVGEQRLQQVLQRSPPAHLDGLAAALLDYSERLVRAQLRTLPAGVFHAEDFLDAAGPQPAAPGPQLAAAGPQPAAVGPQPDAQPLRIAVTLTLDPVAGGITLDFTGSAPQVEGPLNAVRAITLSACFYVLRCLLDADAPATAGILRPLTLVLPAASIVNAEPPAAVAAGNVETSQRIVDTLLRALAEAAPDRIPAASAGTMTNLTIGGVDPRTAQPFTYYETTAGGMGAGPAHPGLSGVQTHMTNSLNTPVEALEFAYPLRLHRYSYRPGSGGNGRHRGGDGLIKEIELLTGATVTLLSDRNDLPPYGLHGGSPGATGTATHSAPTDPHSAATDSHSAATDLHSAATNSHSAPTVPHSAATVSHSAATVSHSAATDSAQQPLPARSSQHLPAGTVLHLATPGGGGWGDPA